MNIIAGGGKYGSEAVKYHRTKKKGFILVDKDPDCLATKKYNIKPALNMAEKGEYFLQGDMRTVLDLIEKLKLDYLFPTAPIHVAAELVKLKFELRPWPEAINTILSKIPPSVVLKSGRGNLIVSYNRDKDCIGKCATPPICPSTNKSKPCTMDKLMRFAYPQGIFLVSYQMAPGMGALKTSEIINFFDRIEKEEKFVVATTCDCHGVFSSFCKV
ncbi:MAG: hypothetical protein NWF10_03425 [Candidatus Bathyarchaeota archaeon]|nr:hypothetical protein [Candidatus Bathyarchaeota archaeon]